MVFQLIVDILPDCLNVSFSVLVLYELAVNLGSLLGNVFACDKISDADRPDIYCFAE